VPELRDGRRVRPGCYHLGHLVTCPIHNNDQLYWQAVPGQRVFAVCVLLIIVCLVWLGMWMYKGVKFEEK
jgi:hypothetical protein